MYHVNHFSFVICKGSHKLVPNSLKAFIGWRHMVGGTLCIELLLQFHDSQKEILVLHSICSFLSWQNYVEGFGFGSSASRTSNCVYLSILPMEGNNSHTLKRKTTCLRLCRIYHSCSVPSAHQLQNLHDVVDYRLSKHLHDGKNQVFRLDCLEK